jgi:RNA polymerase sigma-70 factor, ECF subfamily
MPIGFSPVAHKGKNLSSAVHSIACKAGPAALHYPERRERKTVERYAFDKEYVERLKRGDAEVERHFAAYFGELLFIKLRGRLRDHQVVADLRQETFVRVFHALRKKNTILYPERLGSFVNSVCENVLSEFFRSGKSTVQIQEDAAEPVDRSYSVESELITEERTRLVRNILSELSEGDRKLLRGIFLDERDKNELCQELKIDRNYLRVRVHRALTRFRSSLQGREPSRASRAAG